MDGIHGIHRLTGREREILSLMEQGDSNKIIAYKLGITEPTVKKHCTYIYLKLGVINRVQAVVRVMNSRGTA